MSAPLRWLAATAVLALSLAGGAPHASAVPPGPPAGTPADLWWAQRLVAEVAPADNRYAAHPTIVRWRETDGRAQNRSVCGTFVAHVMERASGYAPAQIARWLGRAEPLARDFYAAIAHERGFHRRMTIDAVAPGDVLTFRTAPGTRPTGHVMIVAAAPREHDATEPLIPGTTQYAVEIIDSTERPHGFYDTRYRRGDATQTGVGEGTIRLYADASGSIVGYAWSTRSISTFRSAQLRPIAIGRIVGPPPDADVSDADTGSDDASLEP